MFYNILLAFLVGGLICLIVQIIMDTTPFFISTAHVLVALVLTGEILSFFGLYRPFINFASMGASVPLCGFGNTLMEGVVSDLKADGLIGLLTGGFSAGASGLGAAILFGYFVAVIFKPKG
ncbi:MAG: SpoVA/SpoVAEb family sporulation membrane protein [Clostridiales bacterium]